jgi:alkyl sulfatase BDS1-like metallo-beta-lactamase superfamily hydrolase
LDRLTKLADDAWHGRIGQPEVNRALEGTEIGLLPDDNTIYLASRFIVGNVSVYRTIEGLVMVDTGSPESAENILKAIREWDESPIHTVVYTHGHVDHVSGARGLDKEAENAGRPKPNIISHANLPPRFDRYKRSNGWNTAINKRQFRRGDLTKGWPTEFRYPDETYHDSLNIEVGGETFELHHGKGETDDHTWLYAPERNIITAGDFIIWAAPNSGNPQKFQRYTREWAVTLREMAAKNPDVLIPGHGLAVIGADRIQTMLNDIATFLESIHDQTLALMNDGKTLDQVMQGVEVPQHLLEKPYLHPTYDDPEFLIRNIWRFYGGWYDGNPAHLKPASEESLSNEIVYLAGGVDVLADRIEKLMNEGELRLASHLAQWAYIAAPDNQKVTQLRSDLFKRRAKEESTLMAKGIFGEAGDETG